MRRTCPKPTPSIITDSLCGSSTVDITGGDGSSESSRRSLTILLDDDSVYEWFELTETLIAGITLENLVAKIEKYFSVPIARLSDMDGPIGSTCDLRRSLRAAWPTLRVSKEGEILEQEPIATDTTKRVTLRKRNQNDYFGFSNVPSRDG